jgi:protein phosphatase
MIYQDLRPQNIMIDKTGTVKLIDFGAVSIKGINEIDTYTDQPHIKGTATYSAPEYFVGEQGTAKSDLFSLAIIVYQMLSNKFPYAANIARTTTKAGQKKLSYDSLYPQQPIWVDECLRKALSIEPQKRYSELSEFLYDLEKPNKKFLSKKRVPLMQREPIKVWQWISFIQFIVIIFLLMK